MFKLACATALSFSSAAHPFSCLRGRLAEPLMLLKKHEEEINVRFKISR